MKKLISILLVLALALSLAACGLSLGGKGGSPAAKTKVQKPSVIHGMMQEDGTAYVPKDDGSVIKINDDVDTAVLSPDRKTLVVLLTDGTLYYTDAEQSEKHEVADKIDWLSVVRNEGAFYIDEEDDVFCVIFESGETVKLGHDIDGIVAPDSLDSIIYDDDGGIYLYKTGEGSPEKVGRLDGDVAPLCINNDGSLACWYVSDEGKTTLYSYENDERTTSLLLTTTTIPSAPLPPRIRLCSCSATWTPISSSSRSPARRLSRSASATSLPPRASTARRAC